MKTASLCIFLLSLQDSYGVLVRAMRGAIILLPELSIPFVLQVLRGFEALTVWHGVMKVEAKLKRSALAAHVHHRATAFRERAYPYSAEVGRG